MFDDNLEKLCDSIAEEINATDNLVSLKSVELKYNLIPHPHIGYRFGERYLINNDKPSAFKHFIHSCSLALNNTNSWINTGYANSVGHCYYYLLTQYTYDVKYNHILSKMFANAYMNLSVCVINMKEEAYDSCRTRGKLTENYSHPTSDQILIDYFNPNILLEKNVLSIGDYFLAAIGLRKYGKQKDSDICMNWANQKFTQVQESYYFFINPNMELYEFVEISEEASLKFVNSLLKAYQAGKFNITENEWNEISNSQN